MSATAEIDQTVARCAAFLHRIIRPKDRASCAKHALLRFVAQSGNHRIGISVKILAPKGTNVILPSSVTSNHINPGSLLTSQAWFQSVLETECSFCVDTPYLSGGFRKVVRMHSCLKSYRQKLTCLKFPRTNVELQSPLENGQQRPQYNA